MDFEASVIYGASESKDQRPLPPTFPSLALPDEAPESCQWARFVADGSYGAILEKTCFSGADDKAVIGPTSNLRYIRAMTKRTVLNLQAAASVADNVFKRVRALGRKEAGDEIEVHEAKFQTRVTAERELAHAQKRPYAVLCDCALSWDVGAPLPTLLQSDAKAFLFFVMSEDDGYVGRLQFEGLTSTSFGSPNDETFMGHPLYGNGFEPYRAMRVINSSWVQHLEKINSVHPRHDPSKYASKKHFIFPFHDTTFECVANSFSASKVDHPLSEAIKEAVGVLY